VLGLITSMAAREHTAGQRAAWHMQNEELQDLQSLAGRSAANGQSGSHSTRVVDSLRSQLSGTTTSFKSVLEVRRSALQAAEARRGLFANTSDANGALSGSHPCGARSLAEPAGTCPTCGPSLAARHSQCVCRCVRGDVFLRGCAFCGLRVCSALPASGRYRST
jgi:hypothetical protein